MKNQVIAIDFDGTCVTNEYPKVGRDVGAVPVLRALVESGHRLILWTMRSSGRADGTDPLTDAVTWFSDRGIPLFGINSNAEQMVWTQSPKAYANIYIDDAALGCPILPGLKGERPFVDWKAVEADLIKREVLPRE